MIQYTCIVQIHLKTLKGSTIFSSIPKSSYIIQFLTILHLYFPYFRVLFSIALYPK